MYTTFTDLGWGSQTQHKAKRISFSFSYIFNLIEMKFDMVMKEFKLNILRILNGLMIDTNKFYILILVYLTLVLI